MSSDVEFFVAAPADAKRRERIEVRLEQVGQDKFTVYLADDDGMIGAGRVIDLVVQHDGRLAVKRYHGPNRRYVQTDGVGRTRDLS